LPLSPDDAGADLAAWDAAAQSYAGTVDGRDSISARFEAFLDDELGPVAGRRILDVGCGPGWLTARLVAAGADAVGVDGSAKLLEIARRHHPGVDFHQADLTAGLGDLADGPPYDRIVALMVLMDVPVLEPLMADVARALAPDGRLVLTIPHPCFWSQSPVEDPQTGERYRKVRAYLPHEQRWVESFGGHRHYHRPLGWYVERLAEVGLAVTRLAEPPTPPRDLRPREQWTDYEVWMSTIPTMVGISARRLRPEAGPGGA